MSGQERDLRCMLRLQSGDERAVEELYDRYSSLLYSVALRILRSTAEAEETLQETWLQVWRKAKSYDPRRGSLVAWLLTLARSRALDRLRSLSSRQRAENQADPAPAFQPPDPAASSAHRQLHERVVAALESLDPKHRQVLEIAYFEGLSQSQIAERLGAPLGTVKSWARQGLLRLRELVPREEWL